MPTSRVRSGLASAGSAGRTNKPVQGREVARRNSPRTFWNWKSWPATKTVKKIQAPRFDFVFDFIAAERAWNILAAGRYKELKSDADADEASGMFKHDAENRRPKILKKSLDFYTQHH